MVSPSYGQTSLSKLFVVESDNVYFYFGLLDDFSFWAQDSNTILLKELLWFSQQDGGIFNIISAFDIITLFD